MTLTIFTSLRDVMFSHDGGDSSRNLLGYDAVLRRVVVGF